MSDDFDIDVRGETLRARQGQTLFDVIAARYARAIERGDYCRTGECAHCEVWLADDAGVLACQRRARPGDRVARVSRHLSADIALPEQR